ncbi:MAG: two-component system response regulator OmpR [Gammaproteobacteria bacterium]|nr:two-component system response regulator OmpR [Gammaproteobacteria bacterium]MCP5196869.1 two-component system response regulator OmpR [Gammaproteobacteria bacterium]
MTSSDPIRILIVDDDARLRALLERYLREQGCTVRGVADGRRLDAALEQEPFDLLVLDLMLPGENGLDICRRLRNQGCNLPILMLTAKGDEVDRIVGLELGADDYLPKPCNPRELLARIRAILRRRTREAPGSPGAPGAIVRFGRCELQLATRRLGRDGQELTLTSGEFALLKALVEHPRRPLTRDHLLDLARGRERNAFDRSVDVQISRLRRLVEPDPTQPRYIQTVWGVGYVFVPDEPPC